MSQYRRLLLVAIFNAFLLIPIIFYFRFFPIILNSFITNCLVVSLIITIILLFSYGSLLIKRLRDAFFLIPQATIFTFVSMALPNLRLSFPPLQDPYYYLAATMNIADYGSLKPILMWWYPQIDMQLHWPNMNLITTGLSYSTNLDLMQIVRFQEPLLGTLIFLGTFILTRQITKKNNVAFLSALLTSFSSIILFYLSEYHPQGLVYIFFILLLFFYIGYHTNTSKKFVFGILTILVVVVLVLTHHFSSLFLGILAIAYLFIIYLICNLPFLKNKLIFIVQDLKKDYSLFGIIAVIMLSYHLFAYLLFGKGVLNILLGREPLSQLITMGPNVSMFTTLLSSTKWVLLILALISVFYITKTKNKDEFRCAILLGCLLIAGFIGTFIVFSPTDRMIGFYLPLASLFASLTIFKLRDHKFKISRRKLPTILLISIISTPIIGGFFSAQSPAYYFHDSKPDTSYWYSNRLPKMDEYKFGGEWSGYYIAKNAIIGTEFDTNTIPFYFGNHSLAFIKDIDNTHNFNYYLINPSIPYGDKLYDKKYFDHNMSIVYDNEELKLYYR